MCTYSCSHYTLSSKCSFSHVFTILGLKAFNKDQWDDGNTELNYENQFLSMITGLPTCLGNGEGRSQLPMEFVGDQVSSQH